MNKLIYSFKLVYIPHMLYYIYMVVSTCCGKQAHLPIRKSKESIKASREIREQAAKNKLSSIKRDFFCFYLKFKKLQLYVCAKGNSLIKYAAMIGEKTYRLQARLSIK